MKPGILRISVAVAASCAATVLLAAASTTSAFQEPKADAPAVEPKPAMPAIRLRAAVLVPAVAIEVRKEAVKAQEPAAKVEQKNGEPAEKAEVADNADVAVGVAVPVLPPFGQAEAEGDEKAEAIDNELLQYVQQLRPILRAELHRLRLVTKASDDQIKAIAADGNKAVIAAARVIVKQMRGGMQNLDKSQDPVDAIGQEVEKLASAHLTPDQQTLYAAERRKQIARQRRSATRLLVGALDEELGLTTDQRAKIMQAIEENWQDGWLRALAVAQFGRQYLPRLSDPVVEPYLNVRQKKLWIDQKRNHQQIFGFFWHSNFDNSGLEPAVEDQMIQQGVGMGVGVMMVEEAVVEEKAAEPEAVEEKADEKKDDR